MPANKAAEWLGFGLWALPVDTKAAALSILPRP
jgi:hypothetical protein